MEQNKVYLTEYSNGIVQGVDSGQNLARPEGLQEDMVCASNPRPQEDPLSRVCAPCVSLFAT